jgi:hypothetical protein
MPDRGRRDIPLHPKQVLRVSLRLDPRGAHEVGAAFRLDAVAGLFVGEEVDAGATGRRPLRVVPGGARPDTGSIVVRVLPGGGDIQHGGRVAVSHRRVIAAVPAPFVRQETDVQ